MLLNTFAPPFRLVGGYFVAGILFLLLSIAAFFGTDLGDILGFRTAGFLHVCLLGFVMSIVIGALYQLTSVILEKAFYTVKFAFLNLIFYAVGVSAFCGGLYFEKFGLMHAGAGITFLSLLFFGTTYFLSFFGANKRSVAVFALQISAAFLLAGISLGFALVMVLSGALALDFNLLLAYHIYFVLGFVFLVIVGVASVLLPMFALVHDLKFTLSKISIALFLIAGILLKFSLNLAFIAVGASVLCFLAEAFLIIKKRVRKAYDYWNLNLLFSLAWLSASVAFVVFDKVEFAVFTLLYGFLYAFIVGHLYKIMPFLIWYHYVAKFVGKMKVPMLDNMMIKWAANVSLGLHAIAMCANLSGFSRLGAICLFASAAFVVLNVINFLKYTKFGEDNER